MTGTGSGAAVAPRDPTVLSLLNQVRRLQLELASSEARNKRLEEHYQSSSERVQSTLQALSEAKKRYNALRAEADQLRARNQQLEMDNRRRCDELEKTCADYRARSDRLLSSYQRSLDKIHQQQTAMRKICSRIRISQLELERATQTRAEHDEIVAQMKSFLGDLWVLTSNGIDSAWGEEHRGEAPQPPSAPPSPLSPLRPTALLSERLPPSEPRAFHPITSPGGLLETPARRPSSGLSVLVTGPGTRCASPGASSEEPLPSGSDSPPPPRGPDASPAPSAATSELTPLVTSLSSLVEILARALPPLVSAMGAGQGPAPPRPPALGGPPLLGPAGGPPAVPRPSPPPREARRASPAFRRPAAHGRRAPSTRRIAGAAPPPPPAGMGTPLPPPRAPTPQPTPKPSLATVLKQQAADAQAQAAEMKARHQDALKEKIIQRSLKKVKPDEVTALKDAFDSIQAAWREGRIGEALDALAEIKESADRFMEIDESILLQEFGLDMHRLIEFQALVVRIRSLQGEAALFDQRIKNPAPYPLEQHTAVAKSLGLLRRHLHSLRDDLSAGRPAAGALAQYLGTAELAAAMREQAEAIVEGAVAAPAAAEGLPYLTIAAGLLEGPEAEQMGRFGLGDGLVERLHGKAAEIAAAGSGRG
eukprot:tig00020912_g15827.t1